MHACMCSFMHIVDGLWWLSCEAGMNVARYSTFYHCHGGSYQLSHGSMVVYVMRCCDVKVDTHARTAALCCA